MNWLAHFQSWFDSNQSVWHQRGITAVFSSPGPTSDKNALYADIENAACMGRITVWDSGECDAEIVSVNSGQTILWNHYHFRETTELVSTLNAFIDGFCHSPGAVER